MADHDVTLEFIQGGSEVSSLYVTTDGALNLLGISSSSSVGTASGEAVNSYNTKYRFEFTSRLGTLRRIDVKQKNYSGSINMVSCADAEPVIIEREPYNPFKLNPIYGSKAEVRFKSTTSTWQFSEFLSSSEDEYLISIYEGVSYDLIWSGFAVPDMFGIPFGLKNPTISLNCVDMLSVAGSKEFKKKNGSSFSGRNSLETYLKEFFKTVGTDIDTLYDGTNIRETSSIDYDTSFFSQYFYHADVFKDEIDENGQQKFFTWSEFLRSVLVPLGCAIELSDGAFHIVNVEAKKGTYRRIPITGIKSTWVYGTAEDYNPVATWPDSSSENYMIDRSGFVKCDDIYKEQSVRLATGIINLQGVRDGLFGSDAWNTSTDLINWTGDLGFTYQRVSAAGIVDSDAVYGVQIDGKNSTFDDTSPSTDVLSSTAVSCQVNDGTGNTFSYSYYAKTSLIAGNGTNGSTIYTQVILNSGGTSYYYDADLNVWTPTITYVSHDTTNTYNAWRKFEYLDIPMTVGAGTLASATIQVNLVKIKSTEVGVDGVQFTDVNITFDTVAEYESVEVNTSSLDRTIVPEEITLVTGDAPSIIYSSSISLGSDDYSTKTTTWQRNGYTEAKSLHAILSEVVMSDAFYNKANFILTSDILGGFKPHNVLKYSSSDLGLNKYLIPTGLRWDLRRDEYSGEWKEILEELYT